jgi:hypothetical protein
MIHITLGGERRPFKFGFNAIDIFCREHSIGIAEFANRLEQLAGGSAHRVNCAILFMPGWRVEH